MNHQLLQPQVRAYLLQHLHENAAVFLLRSHPFQIDNKELAQQLIGLQKAHYKFPVLFENDQVIYPPKVNLEQTSSWETAVYKGSIIKGDSMIDLTGGMGIDDIAFAKAYSTTIHIELDPTLQQIANHNFKALNSGIESHQGNGISFLTSTEETFDLIYLDPSRKTAATNKAVLLADYEPDVTKYQDLLFEKGATIMMKTSPMLDITAGMRQLAHVSQIHIVAVKNEVKELLWILNRNSTQTQVTAVNLATDQPDFKYTLDQDAPIQMAELQKYLYEPNAAIMKSQAFGELSAQFQVSKIDQDAHLFTHDEIIKFPGRSFEVLSVQDYKPKAIKRQFGKGAHAVVTRNFRESVKKIRTIFNFTEHETNYLFFTSIAGRGPVVIEAIKI
ncbi:THUMP-like domain-containing protein [Nonlabens agnitus]|uniref:Methyltransferase n=1 Tax=Nonlabens agnitus TaxID=870484 RepID=A0A2S9WRL5_9FLAO|nr:class I SAM-dependent methyltransferase [Nonlabens agnitus]PRP66138.1 methyltransferase [Nonlabens agnitus]